MLNSGSRARPLVRSQYTAAAAGLQHPQGYCTPPFTRHASTSTLWLYSGCLALKHCALPCSTSNAHKCNKSRADRTWQRRSCDRRGIFLLVISWQEIVDTFCDRPALDALAAEWLCGSCTHPQPGAGRTRGDPTSLFLMYPCPPVRNSWRAYLGQPDGLQSPSYRLGQYKC